jgi:hypothetical protein
MSKKNPELQNKKNWRDRILTTVRLLLLVSLLLNLFFVGFEIFLDGAISKTEIFVERYKRMELAFWTLVTLLLTFVPGYIRKHQKLNIPEILEITIVLFVYAGMFFSVRFDMYYRFWWWDDLLHTLAGIVIGFASFIFMYKINLHYKLNIRPGFLAFLAFTIAVTAGVVWEILEFTSDMLFKTAHQKWNLSETEVMIGQSYQGSGLRDTMSDLIVNSIGAFFTSLFCYFLYKKEANENPIP